jgi:hypothetical protein
MRLFQSDDGDSVIMLSDEFPEMGGRSPQSFSDRSLVTEQAYQLPHFDIQD